MCAGPAFCQTLQFIAALTGAAQSPPNSSNGVGTAVLTVDLGVATFPMRVEALFGGLSGNVTAANVHAPTAQPGVGVAGIATTVPSFPGFPLGVTSGYFLDTFELSSASSYNPAFIAANGGTVSGARSTLLAAMINRNAYFNLRTGAFPDGEIRGFFNFNDLRGDFNDDEGVNAADYTVWRNSLGQTGSNLPADADGDNVVDTDDYLLWKANFGHQFVHVVGGGGISLVPEPAPAIVAGIALAALVCGRRRPG
jgi:hypothetical protein